MKAPPGRTFPVFGSAAPDKSKEPHDGRELPLLPARERVQRLPIYFSNTLDLYVLRIQQDAFGLFCYLLAEFAIERNYR